MAQHGDGVLPKVARAEAFVRGESTLTVLSEQAFDALAAQLEAGLAAQRLSVLHIHELGELASSAAALRCRIYEVIDRQIADELITFDIGLAHLLPWRVLLHDQRGMATVTTPMPTVTMTEFSHAAELARIAKRLETSLMRALRSLR